VISFGCDQSDLRAVTYMRARLNGLFTWCGQLLFHSARHLVLAGIPTGCSTTGGGVIRLRVLDALMAGQIARRQAILDSVLEHQTT
jgi:hypothetical protein